MAARLWWQWINVAGSLRSRQLYLAVAYLKRSPWKWKLCANLTLAQKNLTPDKTAEPMKSNPRKYWLLPTALLTGIMLLVILVFSNRSHTTSDDQFKWRFDANSWAVAEYTGTDVAVVIPSTRKYDAPLGHSPIERFLTSIGVKSIPSRRPVTIIDVNAFYGRTDIKSVTIPDTVSQIGDSAFGSCTGLEDLSMPDSVNRIGSFAFQQCTSLKFFKWPRSTTAISRFTFLCCSNLKLIIIPDSISEVGESAFNNCTSLESITIPRSASFVKYQSFYNCTGLQSVIIENPATLIHPSAFENCPTVKVIRK